MSFETNWEACRLPPEPGKSVFKWMRDPEPSKAPTSDEKARAYAREYYHRNKLQLAAKRVNKDTYTPTTQADADKTAKLMGKSNGARLP